MISPRWADFNSSSSFSQLIRSMAMSANNVKADRILVYHFMCVLLLFEVPHKSRVIAGGKDLLCPGSRITDKWIKEIFQWWNLIHAIFLLFFKRIMIIQKAVDMVLPSHSSLISFITIYDIIDMKGKNYDRIKSILYYS